jgi:hypothetical protein
MLKSIAVIVTLTELSQGAEGASVSDELAVANAYVQWYLMISCLLAGMLLGYLLYGLGRRIQRELSSLVQRQLGNRRAIARMSERYDNLQARVDILEGPDPMPPGVESGENIELADLVQWRQNQRDSVTSPSRRHGGKSHGKGKGRNSGKGPISRPLYGQPNPTSRSQTANAFASSYSRTAPRRSFQTESQGMVLSSATTRCSTSGRGK